MPPFQKLSKFDRLNFLYKIITKEGISIDFHPNWAQAQMLNDVKNRNLILKCRQIGSTTFWSLYLLDIALSEPNSFCGIIAYKMDIAKDIFRRIINAILSLPIQLQNYVFLMVPVSQSVPL